MRDKHGSNDIGRATVGPVLMCLRKWVSKAGFSDLLLPTRLQAPLIIAVHFFIYLFSRSLLRLTTGHSVTSIGRATQHMYSLFVELKTGRPIFSSVYPGLLNLAS